MVEYVCTRRELVFLASEFPGLPAHRVRSGDIVAVMHAGLTDGRPTVFVGARDLRDALVGSEVATVFGRHPHEDELRCAVFPGDEGNDGHAAGDGHGFLSLIP